MSTYILKKDLPDSKTGDLYVWEECNKVYFKNGDIFDSWWSADNVENNPDWFEKKDESKNNPTFHYDKQGKRKELPQYQSHKIVWALKIKEVTIIPTTPEGARISPENSGYAAIFVDEFYMNEHKPYAGGYYVVYKDGYKSFSPAAVFEEDNTLITDKGDISNFPVNNDPSLLKKTFGEIFHAVGYDASIAANLTEKEIEFAKNTSTHQCRYNNKLFIWAIQIKKIIPEDSGTTLILSSAIFPLLQQNYVRVHNDFIKDQQPQLDSYYVSPALKGSNASYFTKAEFEMLFVPINK